MHCYETNRGGPDSTAVANIALEDDSRREEQIRSPKRRSDASAFH
jgi:hypothetical protein